MSNKQTLLIFFFALILQASSRVSAQIERKNGIASCHFRELELCMLGSVSMFQNPKGIPIQQSEFKRQCEYLHESGHCFEDYRDNCMTKLQSSLVDMFATDFINFERDFCTNGTKPNTIYMKHANCFHQVQKKHQRPCLSNLQVGFEAIHKIPHNLRMPTSCW